jgi:hypothetical protein
MNNAVVVRSTETSYHLLEQLKRLFGRYRPLLPKSLR